MKQSPGPEEMFIFLYEILKKFFKNFEMFFFFEEIVKEILNNIDPFFVQFEELIFEFNFERRGIVLENKVII